LTLASVLIADKKTRVAIVDADFNHPQVAQSISLIPSKGLEEAIDGPEVDLGAVTTLIAGRLDIVPLLKPIAADAIDRRRLGTMQTFLRTLRREYDVVLIDAGPWETGHPPLVLECRGVDAVVCVCRAQSTDGEPPGEKNFQQPGVEWLGVVETFVKAPPLDSRHN
jgi:Mrp family chromosome partitioning ATPase